MKEQSGQREDSAKRKKIPARKGGSGEGTETPSVPTFDERLTRLESLVADLEGGELPLEGAIGRYREGVELLRDCRGLLLGFRQQVEELDAAGGVQPFEGDPDVGSEDPR